jgi:hypothetical protein
MRDTIHHLAHALWPLVPEITTGLRFGAALIGFGLAVGALIHRLRRRQRAHRSSDPVVNPARPGSDQ